MKSTRALSRLLVALAAIAVVAAVLTPTGRNAAPLKDRPKSGELQNPAESDSTGGDPADAGGTGDRIVRTGSAPITGPLNHARTPGWTGEQIASNSADDWEPAVAADPSSPYLVELITRYTASGAACPTCGVPYIIERRSSDGGATFGPDQYLCACLDQTHGQYDPQIAVDSGGNFYTAWIQGRNIVFQESTDHGATWTPFVNVSSPVTWGDHPWITVSPGGQDVYINFNHAESWIAASHDGGATWNPPVQTSHSGFFHYSGGGYVAPSGRVTFVDEAYGHAGGEHVIQASAIWSNDTGATWHTKLIDTFDINPPCTVAGCFNAFLGGHAAVAGDANGNVVVAYDGSVTPGGNEFVFVRRSTNAGATWSARTRISPASGARVAGFPAIAATGNGDFRVWYQDNRKGTNAWNTWYRRSTDGGVTWTPDVRISDATSGTGYKHHRGYVFPYGDYGELAITSTGKTFAVWGEGFSYTGPGGVWANRQT